MIFEIYGSKNCSFCTKAVDLLNKEGHEFGYTDIKEDKEGYNYIVKELELKTIPQIFVFNDDTNHWDYVGGYDQLVEFI